MLKSTLTAATVALLLAGPASADNDWRDRGHDRREHRDDHDRGHWRPNWHHHPDWRGRGDYRAYRYWRYVPPVRYRVDYGYRSGYELAWRDWDRYGRHDRDWRRWSPGFGVGFGYREGYEAGWRDAASYYGRGYRPGYWAYDPRDGWYFDFHISG